MGLFLNSIPNLCWFRFLSHAVLPVLCKQLLLITAVLYGVFHLSCVSWLYSCVWNKQVALTTWPLQAWLWSFFFVVEIALFCFVSLAAANLCWERGNLNAGLLLLLAHTEHHSEKKPLVTAWSMSGDEILILWSVLPASLMNSCTVEPNDHGSRQERILKLEHSNEPRVNDTCAGVIVVIAFLLFF